MGQYFRIVNLDKREWYEPDGWKLWELCANNSIRMLGYLLATDNPDGTSLIKWFNTVEEARRRYGEGFTVLSRPGSSPVCGIPSLRYFGRWCGDRVAIIGDYAERAGNFRQGWPSFHDLNGRPGEWREITEGLTQEFNDFIELEELMISPRPSLTSPDILVSLGGIQINPKVGTPPRRSKTGKRVGVRLPAHRTG